MNLSGEAREVVNWIRLGQSKVNYFRVPNKEENFLTRWVTVSFSGRTVLHKVKCYSLDDILIEIHLTIFMW